MPPDPRVLLLTNFVPPYREEVYRHASALLGGRFSVCTLAGMERGRAWPESRHVGFELRTLPGLQLLVRSLELPIHLNLGVARAIREAAPDVVVLTSFASPAFWRAQQVCRRDGRRLVFWCGSHASSGLLRSPLLMALRRRFVGRCDAFLTYGTLATRYLVSLGAAPARIVTSTNAVDTRRFEAGIPDRDATRAALGWSGRKVVMYSGRLIPLKAVDVLIAAVARAGGDPLLAIVGDGPERPALERRARALLGDRARFLGDRPYGELPSLYGAADVFVLPSRREVWGLVVNEALAAGVPVVASTATGAAHDLIGPTGAGLLVEPDDELGLTAALRHILDDDEARARMRHAAREAVATRDCAAYARDLVRAISLATAGAPPAPELQQAAR